MHNTRVCVRCESLTESEFCCGHETIATYQQRPDRPLIQRGERWDVV